MADKNLRLQIILEALDKVTAPLKAIAGASSSARRDLSKTHDELKALDALQQQVGRFKSAESRFGNDTRAYQETQAKLVQLRAQLDATEKPTKKLRTEFERAEKQSAQLTARLDQGGAELQQLSSKLSAAGIDVANLAQHEDHLASRTAEANQALRKQTAQLEKVNQANRNSQQLNDVSQKATGMGLGMIATGVAAGAPIVIATKQAMVLESAMADVRKVTNMVPVQIQQLSNDFMDLSEKIPMTAAELAAIAAAAGAAGVGMDKMGRPMADQRKQLLQFTNDAAEMGVAFDMTADVAGETMAKWRTAFELPQAGIVALGDRVNALTNTFGGKAANVTDIITRIGPLGKVAGLAAPQIAALGSTLDSIGVPSEVAATGIKNTMLALTKGEAATKAQQGAFKALGLSATDVAKRMQQDAAGAIVDVMDRIGQLDAEKQSGILTQLFGSESVSAIAPMLTNLDGLKARLALVGDESQTAGSMHGEFLSRIATTEGATGLATNALSNLNITMGKALLPSVVELSEKVTVAASGLRDWAQEHPALAKGIMIFMGAGAGLLILLGGLTLAFAALTAAAAPLGIALGPLLLIVAAIAAVAAAAYLIYDNWDGIVAWFSSLWEDIKGYFNAAIVGITDLFLNWTLIGLFIQHFDEIMAFVRSLPDKFKTLGGQVIDGLIAGLKARFPMLTALATKIGSLLSGGTAKQLDIHSPSRVFAQIGGHVMDGLDQGLAANTSGPLSRISELSGQMTRALSVGAVGAAMAASPVTAQPTGSAAGTAGAPMQVSYTIHINAGGAAAQDIADAVREAIEKIKREEEGRTFRDNGG